MLNLTEIATRIKQPETSSASDVDALKTLCETYPYSQVFPLLYLKTLSITNDVRLDAELQKHAFKVADRKTLFELIDNQKEIVAPIEKQEKTIIVEENSIETKNSIVEQGSDLEANTKQESSYSSEKNSIGRPDSNPLENEIPNSEKDHLDELILTQATHYSLDEEERKIAEKEQQKNQEEIELEEERQRLISALSNQKGLQHSKDEDFTQKRSFSSWLHVNSTYSIASEEKPESITLVEKFIQTNPKISTPKEKLFENRTDKTELFNPMKKAKESLDEQHLPVSETLAKIFASQGNYPKAIYAYQQLMLIFPEKKTFFATQIEDLNKKINLE